MSAIGIICASHSRTFYRDSYKEAKLSPEEGAKGSTCQNYIFDFFDNMGYTILIYL